MSLLGWARSGVVRLGEALQEGPGEARRGMARRGAVRLGIARQEWQGEARHGAARRGRRGLVSRGVAGVVTAWRLGGSFEPPFSCANRHRCR
jgi:hypothetical protein